MASEQTLPAGQVAQFVFRAPPGSVVVLGDIDGATLQELVDQAEHMPDDRRVLFVRLSPAASVEAHVQQVIGVLAETVMRLWPFWFTDVSFAMCRDDALGRPAAGVIVREAAAQVPGINSTWAKAAARLALTGRTPRVHGVLPAVELAQLSLATSRVGLIFVADASAAEDHPSGNEDRSRGHRCRPPNSAARRRRWSRTWCRPRVARTTAPSFISGCGLGDAACPHSR